jgi:curved DNA-binding protein CbpA
MASQIPDPYKILGVAKDAQLPEIRSAHRKLVLKCHPDKVQDPTLKAHAQDEFQRVQTAYETLADEKERKRYDDQVRLAELREQMRAKTAASASSRATAAAASSPASSRPTPTSTTYKYEIHTNDRTYKTSSRQPSPSPRGYSSYSRSYEEEHPRAADIFEGVRTVRREKSYNDKSSKREDREREKELEREREKEYAREIREREKERERERERRRRADEAIRRAEKEAKEAAKEARRAEKKTRDKSRKREPEEKKRHTSKPYIETFDGEAVPKSDKKKSSKKHDERRERDRSSHREEVPPPTTSSMQPPPIPVEYQSKADAALNYIQASRSKGTASFTARHVQPPAPTPPPVSSPFAAPEDDDARRSAAKPRRGSSGEKAYSKPEVVDDPVEATPPSARPHIHKSATATGAPTNSPPRRDLPRTTTMPVEGYSRHVPGMARAQTFSGAYPDPDPRGRGRTRLQAQIPESDSEDEYERHRRERKAHRSKKHRSPEARAGEHIMQYRVDGNRTTLQNSYSRTAEDAYSSYYTHHQPGVRVVERPSMPSRDASYNASYAKYPKVKTSSYGDVQFSEYPSYNNEAYAT